MWKKPPQEPEGRSWLYAILWTLLIYSTIPLARAIQGWVSEHFGRSSYSVVVYAAVAVALLAVIWLAGRKRISLTWSGGIWLAAVGAAYAYFTYELREAPEEALHFIQYGVLGLLVTRAFSHRIRDPLLYLCATLLGGLIGAFDEVIQWYTPRRFFDFRDMGINAGAVVLMQGAIAFGLRPTWVARPVRPASIRIACRLAVLNLALLFICVSGTPDRIAWYRSRAGWLSHIDESMAQYGFRHTDPDTGVFFSRFTREELRQEDTLYGKRAARILNEYHDPRKYEACLRRYTVLVDPFVHEARVHLFRRDRYLHEATADGISHDDVRDLHTVAYRENQIVEKFFPNTLRHSVYGLRADVAQTLAANARLDQPYKSAVSASLITRVTERQLQGALLFGILVLLIVHGYYERRNERPRR